MGSLFSHLGTDVVISKSPPQRKKLLDASGLVQRTAAKSPGSGFLSVPEDAGLLSPCQMGLLSQGAAQEPDLHLTLTHTIHGSKWQASGTKRKRGGMLGGRVSNPGDRLA